MRNIVKVIVVAIVLGIGLTAFFFTRKSETQTLNPLKTPENVLDATREIAGYKDWTKVNQTPERIESRLSALCARPTQSQIERDAKNPHNDKFITVYVNAIGKDAMMTKKLPKFPVGTVIVKEKLTTAESTEPELLTVMIKREKNYNPMVGDWEFLTFNGAGTETTARGKLENCQSCHLAEKSTDYVSRKGYLPVEIWRKLK